MPTHPRSLWAPAWWLWAPASAPGALVSGWLAGSFGPLPPRCAGPPRGASPPPPGARWLLGRAPPPLVGSRSPCGLPSVVRRCPSVGWCLSAGSVLSGGACRWCSLRGAGFTGAGRPCGLTPPCPCLCSVQYGPSSGPGATFGGPGSLRPGPCVSVVPWAPLSLRPLPLCVYRTYVLIGVEKPVECVYNQNKCRGKE